MLTRNVEPRPGSVSTLTLPPSSSTRRLTMWRPSPTPPNRRVEEPSAWRNISGRSAAAMPMPVSRTSNVSRPLARAAVTSTLPAGVNLRALPTRFFKMVFSLTPSLGTGWMPRAAAAPCQPRRALCIVARRRIAEVRERVDREGTVLVPLGESGVVSALERLVGEEGVESLAVCLLWSFRNPAHERRVAAIVRERYPDLPVSCSADLVPVVREYERMTATVLSAYATRSCAAFLDELEARLATAGLRVPVAVMQSSGGTLSPAAARARPILLAQSGPVAGVAAAEALAAALGVSEVVTGDMGGTSFDVAVIHAGAAERRLRAEVASLATALSTG